MRLGVLALVLGGCGNSLVDPSSPFPSDPFGNEAADPAISPTDPEGDAAEEAVEGTADGGKESENSGLTGDTEPTGDAGATNNIDTGERTNLDSDEPAYLTDPSVADSAADPFEVDSDGDGLSDGWETSTRIRYFVGGNTPWRNGTTDPLNPDSDGDGLLDGEETADAGDPNSSNPLMLDTDEDNWTDAQERRAGSWPNHADTDGDQVPDGSDPCPIGQPCVTPVPHCADGHSLCP